MHVLFWAVQAFRLTVGPGHCPMISKYGPSLSKAVGPVDPVFLVMKKSHFNKEYSSYSKSTNSTKQKVHVGCQYGKTCLKQLLKKDKTKILKHLVTWSILQYFWPALSDNWSSFLINYESIYIYAYKCLCQCVGKVYYPNVNCV